MKHAVYILTADRPTNVKFTSWHVFVSSREWFNCLCQTV